jgi:hypothetical protein
MMSKTYCRFCELRFVGLYLNCPKCGKWLAPRDLTDGSDIDPENCAYEIVEEQDDFEPLEQTGRVDEIMQLITAHQREAEIRARIDENDYHWHRQKAIEAEAKTGISGYFLDRIAELKAQLKDTTKQSKEGQDGL